jgi:hypothetical protein
MGCDFNWGGTPLSELCPVTCDSCGEREDVEGCMEDSACNYNPDATVDDGSCMYDVAVSIDLSTGWNWFSLNVEGELDVNSVLGSIGGSGILIKNQTDFAEYYDDYWYGIGGLEYFDMTSMYMIQMNESSTLTYEGAPIDHSTTSIDLSEGWNWISYLPQSWNSVGDALANIGDSGGLRQITYPIPTFREINGSCGVIYRCALICERTAFIHLNHVHARHIKIF